MSEAYPVTVMGFVVGARSSGAVIGVAGKPP